MATTSITITDEAHGFLKSIKGDKSFSETILSMRKDKSNIMKYAGIFKDVDLSSVEKVREELNSGWERRSRQLFSD
jgi:predicted CopG family antitoxin